MGEEGTCRTRQSDSYRTDDSDAADAARWQRRLAEMREDISTRLWPIMQGMSSVRFNALMDQMALLQFNGERTSCAVNLVEVNRRLGTSDRRNPDGSPPL